FIDNFHDILGIVSVLAIVNVDIIAPQKIKLSIFSIIYFRNFRLYMLGSTTPAALRILIHYMIEYLS
ncbi:MAG: hypothetical protein KDD45_06355, partial [Bdellovibrionales bacterium]|nr:hypothetical protein [Bdellovibrionales bacterium]